ncbi:MAG TPA: geranylgeranylglycerol-phosphate geranylgeranyltransferase [Puia sp.]|jgi:4-hydroxybenzoate polyprenyltransferase|nr:geranylgeranylglycerol-phosphate geranylgeranyltransferase [Puia sp.]
MVRLLGAFFRLIRWPNLVFIALTQGLFYYCIMLPDFRSGGINYVNVLQPRWFYLLTVSSVLIAAAGYIINDYFDLNIDRVNKPDKLVVDRIIKRRSTILWHWVLSGLGVAIGAYVSLKTRNPFAGLGNLACVILLWFYSTTFKRRLLIGNVIISLLTAWVILVLYMAEFRLAVFRDPVVHGLLSRLFKFAILYGGFAFIISLIREVIKDIEDLPGDERYGCRTMPIVWGVNAAKVFAATWLVVLIGSLAVIQFYVLQNGWWIILPYCAILIILPLIWILRGLYRATTTADYHLLSTYIKGVMLAGILSMIFIKIV